MSLFKYLFTTLMHTHQEHDRLISTHVEMGDPWRSRYPLIQHASTLNELVIPQGRLPVV